MSPRKRHQRKDWETLLTEYEDKGWTIEKGKKHYKAKCPAGDCLVIIQSTPSSSRSLQNKRSEMGRCPHGIH